jgi:hypothetical protein
MGMADAAAVAHDLRARLQAGAALPESQAPHCDEAGVAALRVRARAPDASAPPWTRGGAWGLQHVCRGACGVPSGATNAARASSKPVRLHRCGAAQAELAEMMPERWASSALAQGSERQDSKCAAPASPRSRPRAEDENSPLGRSAVPAAAQPPASGPA